MSNNEMTETQAVRQITTILCGFAAQLQAQDRETFQANLATVRDKCQREGNGTQIVDVIQQAMDQHL
ncbi:hypothetical protein VE30_01960 [Vreelandella aquamarina]|uniref:hypothetical protein n=1 Tax=Vreelandella TaxID=3137766 RepID=UPI0005CC5B46|nr:hypothetical protein [Halomonas meridiana]KJD20510.1 hypothetical protein VE30_01960 [Halomonas meridiana]